MTPPLSDAHERFCQQYLFDLNATAAYQRTYPKAKVTSAGTAGPRLLGNVRIANRIAELQALAGAKLAITAEMVLEQLWDVATADPNELIELRRSCCRHCHGIEHGRQRTVGEPQSGTVKDGGPGYDARKPPHPECPECFGEGVVRIHPRDTRALSRAARRLYAGVKQTKNGLEVKMHDQQAARMAVGKHLGMFKENVDLTSGGKPLEKQVLVIGGQRVEF